MVIEETLFSLNGIGLTFLVGDSLGGIVFERAFHDFSQFYQLPAGLLNSGSSVIPWAGGRAFTNWYAVVLGCWLGYRSRLPEIVNRHEVS